MERGETHGMANCHKGQRDADHDHRKGRRSEQTIGPTAQEWHSSGADRKDDKRLDGKRFDEPAGAELRRPGVQDAKHQPERQEVEQRSD